MDLAKPGLIRDKAAGKLEEIKNGHRDIYF
jgi:hypothetical protein